MYFKNRQEAGEKLSELLDSFRGKNAIVYALPRGGVAVGAEVARKIRAPLDLIITRKLGHPYNPEYAIGAIAENGHTVFNKEEVLDIDPEWLREESERQTMEAQRRRELYLRGRKPLSCKGKIAIIVDDGIATGLTMKAAIKEVKMHLHPQRIIVAVPVAPPEIAQELEKEGVEFVALDIEGAFLGSIGAYYQDFAPVTDRDVMEIMRREAKSGHIPLPAV